MTRKRNKKAGEASASAAEDSDSAGVSVGRPPAEQQQQPQRQQPPPPASRTSSESLRVAQAGTAYLTTTSLRGELEQLRAQNAALRTRLQVRAGYLLYRGYACLLC